MCLYGVCMGVWVYVGLQVCTLSRIKCGTKVVHMCTIIQGDVLSSVMGDSHSLCYGRSHLDCRSRGGLPGVRAVFVLTRSWRCFIEAWVVLHPFVRSMILFVRACCLFVDYCLLSSSSSSTSLSSSSSM